MRVGAVRAARLLAIGRRLLYRQVNRGERRETRRVHGTRAVTSVKLGAGHPAARAVTRVFGDAP